MPAREIHNTSDSTCTVKRLQLSLVTSVAIRKRIKMSTYRETLLTSMAMFGGKKGTIWWQVFKWPLICEAFNRHFGNKQTHAYVTVKNISCFNHMV